MKKTKISVVTVTYNCEATLTDTLDSVFSQTYDNIEVIVVDGESTDDTLNIVNKFSDKIDIVISEPDKGIYDAMNKGVKVSTGDFIIFMNSGDRFASEDIINDIFNEYQDKESIIYGSTLIKYSDSEVRLKKSSDKLSFVTGLPFCHQSVFIPRTVISNYLHDITYSIYSDLNFFLSVKDECIFKKIEKPISIYCLDGVSSIYKTKHEIERNTIIFNHYGVSFELLSSLKYTFVRLIKFIIKSQISDSLMKKYRNRKYC